MTELENLNEVRVGYKTDCFNKLSLSNKTKLSNVDCSKSKCLSLIFGNESAPLDLVSKDQNTRNKLAKVVTKLIEILNDPIGEIIHNPFTFLKYTLSRARPNWANEFPDRTGPDTQIYRTGQAEPD